MTSPPAPAPASPAPPVPGGTAARPKRPPPSPFVIGSLLAAAAITVVAGADWEYGIGFSLREVTEAFSRPNAPMRGLANIDIGRLLTERSRNGFIETVQIAVLGTVGGSLVALPLALLNSRLGAPNRPTYWLVKMFNNVIRSIPELLWALLFVAAVGVGALPGILALFFFSIAVVAKLTSDTVDGIDHGPVEAAVASGSTHTQALRTAVVPQILPAYVSFTMYCFELNMRASAVLGFVGAGGIGAVIDFYRGRGEWDRVWGIVVGFFLVVFLVERVSMALRRRLV